MLPLHEQMRTMPLRMPLLRRLLQMQLKTLRKRQYMQPTVLIQLLRLQVILRSVPEAASERRIIRWIPTWAEI